MLYWGIGTEENRPLASQLTLLGVGLFNVYCCYRLRLKILLVILFFFPSWLQGFLPLVLLLGYLLYLAALTVLQLLYTVVILELPQKSGGGRGHSVIFQLSLQGGLRIGAVVFTSVSDSPPLVKYFSPCRLLWLQHSQSTSLKPGSPLIIFPLLGDKGGLEELEERNYSPSTGESF